MATRRSAAAVAACCLMGLLGGCGDDLLDRIEEHQPRRLIKNEQGQVIGLDLSRAGFEVGELEMLERLPNLQSLNLSLSSVTDADLKHIDLLPELKTLDLGGTFITGEGLADLAGNATIESLNLQHCPKFKVENFKHLQDWSALTSLTASHMVIRGDQALEYIARIPNLTYFDMLGVGASDEGLRQLSEMSQLQMLNIGGPKITDEGLEHLKNLKQLGSLTLQNTAVTSRGVRMLKRALPEIKNNIYLTQSQNQEKK